MRAATTTAISLYTQNPDLLPSNLTADTIQSLINLCLDNSYFEFNGQFYSQDTGGTMGSPLVVELSEIRVAETEQTALSSSPDPPLNYRHFVDDGIGSFRDRQHADSYLSHINSLNPDLQYTIEHPSPDGSLPYLDLLIHPDKSTSIYRKPTHTNLYVKYNSCAPNSSKFSVIRSLTRRAYELCSPQHLDAELHTVYTTCLQNGYPPAKVTLIMDDVKTKFLNPSRSLSHSQFTQQTTSPALLVNLPYHPTLNKPLKSILLKHDVAVKNSSGTSLRNILTKTKTTPPPHLTPNAIYEVPCNDCPAFYTGQTYRPVHKRIKEHEACFRNNTAVEDLTGNIKSAPAHHALTTGHNIAWNRTTVLTSTRTRSQLDLTEHAAIQTRKPPINRVDRAPKCTHLWNPILPKIASTFHPSTAGISL